MLFSSTFFLFAFLPVVLTLHWALRGAGARNALLLVASLFFYAWGETGYIGHPYLKTPVLDEMASSVLRPTEDIED